MPNGETSRLVRLASGFQAVDIRLFIIFLSLVCWGCYARSDPPEGSLESGTTFSRVLGISSRRGSPLQGDLITGMIDITHDLAWMLLAIRGEDRTKEKKALVCNFSLSC